MNQPVFYRYFRDPHRFGPYSQVPKQCDLCAQVRSGYDGPFYTEEEIEFVCEDCLRAGRLADRNATTSEGDTEALRQQLARLHPQWSQEQLEQVVRERTAELEQRTPHLTTWQDWSWPVHCGDYCRHVKEAGARDLITLAPDGDGQAFLAAHLHPDLRFEYGEEGVRRMWEGMQRFRAHEDESRWSDDNGIYLFQCLECAEYVILHDYS